MKRYLSSSLSLWYHLSKLSRGTPRNFTALAFFDTSRFKAKVMCQTVTMQQRSKECLDVKQPIYLQ